MIICKKKNKNLKVVQGVNFESKYLSKNNGTEYLLTVDVSCEEIRTPEAFADIASAARK